jgi:hypothetical protein
MTFNKLRRDEKGQALILVLILILLGGIIIGPLLAHISSGLKVGKEVYEERMYGQYAADSGVEDALYKIKFDDPALPEDWEGIWEDPDIYSTSHPYTISGVNGNDVDVTIQPFWILTGLEDPSKGMLPHSEMVVVGNTVGDVGDNGLYQISINYDLSKGQLFIMRIGAWLPPGFEYVEDSSSLENVATSEKYYCVPVTEEFRGGYTIIWEYSSPYPKFEDFPGGSEGKVAVTFQFTPAGTPTSAFSWVREKRGDVYLSWDVGVKTFKITSQATDENTDKKVTVEAYASKNETPGMGSSMSGDYVAIGNSLMMPDPNNNPYDSNQDWRNRLLKESDATITSDSIPADATIEAAYLYWSGFMDYHYMNKKQMSGWSWVPNPYTEAYWCDPNETRGVQELNYNNYSGDPSELVENAKVNTVSFGGGSVTQDITADNWEVAWKCNDSPACWYYTCFYDATDIVKPLIEEDSVSTFTLGHASDDTHHTSVINELRPSYNGVPGSSQNGNYFSFTLYDKSGDSTSDYTGYPLGCPATKLPWGEWYYHARYHASYAGWSLIIIYSSLETEGHQLYLYDIRNASFRFVESFPGGAYGSNPDFDGDGSPGGRIGGFLVPEPIADEVNAAHMSCFVGEGDKGKTGDSFKVTGPSGTGAYLLDGVSGTVWNDVWNGQSVGITAPANSGVDIDTFYVTWSSEVLNPGDTRAQIDIDTTGDGFTLSYIILSFRSSIKTSGTMSYLYVGGE